jgi:hypothetical protein
MLKERDEQWLCDTHPALVQVGPVVAGAIEFKASYDEQGNIFVIHGNGVTGQEGAVTLSGSFQIRIEERTDKSTSRLPALYVQGVDPTDDRHFNQQDKSACLCIPFEEDEFFQPEFQFRVFLERLVIPFLYGQIFYSSRGRWPWTEYAHGATGILEAYSKICDQNRATECLRLLAQDRGWPRIKSALRQNPQIKGHTPCFCPKMDHIRRCHPGALKGALRLQQDINALGLPIP